MKVLISVIVFILLFVDCFASESFPPSSTKTSTSYDHEVELASQVEPDGITGAQIMMYFIPKAMGFDNGQSEKTSKALRERISDKVGLDIQSRKAVVKLIKSMLAEFEQLGDQSVQCRYIRNNHTRVTGEQIAQMKNQYIEDVSELFGRVYDDLDIVLAEHDAVNLKIYLRQFYLGKSSYATTRRVFKADDIEVQHLIKTCLPKSISHF